MFVSCRPDNLKIYLKDQWVKCIQRRKKKVTDQLVTDRTRDVTFNF